MAEKIVIAEFDLDMEAAIKETIRLKEENVKLRATLKDVKESEGELSSEYIQNSAALKANQSAIRTQEQLLIKATTATTAQAGSVDQLRAQLSIVSKQWSALSEDERNNTDVGRELSLSKLALTEALKAEEKSTGDATRNVGNYQEASKSLKLELRENTVALAKMKAAGEDGTEAYKKLLKITGELQDTIADTREEIKKYASDTQGLDQAIGIFKGIGSAAQIAESAQALLGSENEEITKSIQKMVAIQSLLNGAQEIGNALQKESAFMIGIKNVAVKTATAWQWLWNAAITAGAAPLTLIIAGAAGLAAGLVWLSNKFSINSSEIEKNKKLLKQLEYQLESSSKFDEFYLKLLAARGAKDTDVTNQQIANAKDRIAILEKEAKAQDSNREYDNSKKTYEEINKLKDDIVVLEAQRAEQLKKIAEEKALAEEEADKAFTELNIKNATIRYEMNKTKRDQALKETQVNYDQLISTEKLLYSQGSSIAKKELDAKLITQAEYNQKIQELAIAEKEGIEEINRQRAEKAVSDLNFELEAYKLNNKSKIKSDEDLSEASIQAEKERLDNETKEQIAVWDVQLKNKLLSQNDYNIQVLQLEDANQVAIQDLRSRYDERENQRKIEVAQTNFDNEMAVAEGSIFKQLELQRQFNETKKAEELAAAEKIGASRTLIEQKYSRAAITISRAERDAKLNLYSQFSQNIATIAGENTKIGKAAAVAATTINTYQSATAAYTGMVETIEGPWGIVAGIAAAAASVIMGLSNVRKILSVNPGSTPSGGGEAAAPSLPQLTSTLQSANTDIGAGIVSRGTDTGQAGQGAKISSVLVVDKVTDAQNIESSKVATSTI